MKNKFIIIAVLLAALTVTAISVGSTGLFKGRLDFLKRKVQISIRNPGSTGLKTPSLALCALIRQWDRENRVSGTHHAIDPALLAACKKAYYDFMCKRIIYVSDTPPPADEISQEEAPPEDQKNLPNPGWNKCLQYRQNQLKGTTSNTTASNPPNPSVGVNRGGGVGGGGGGVVSPIPSTGQSSSVSLTPEEIAGCIYYYPDIMNYSPDPRAPLPDENTCKQYADYDKNGRPADWNIFTYWECWNRFYKIMAGPNEGNFSGGSTNSPAPSGPPPGMHAEIVFDC